MRVRHAYSQAAGLLAMVLLPLAARASVDAFTFRPRVDYSAWTAPFHVTLGDVNNDGYPDMAVANSGVPSIALRMGAGDGTLLGVMFLGVGYGPRWVTLADVNHDQNLDLVSANTGNSTVTVLLGNGQGAFVDRVDYMTSLSPSSVVVADMTGDQHPDLVVASFGSGGRVEILPGNGSGGFGQALMTAVGSAPYAVEAADLNADGILDLVVADHVTAAAHVLLGTGGGSFALPTAYPTPSPPWSVVTGDVNEDGRLDFVTANDASPTLSLYLGAGDGLFTHLGNLPCGPYPYSVAIGDLDGDSHVDLVATNDVSHAVSLLPGAGDGTFGPATSLPTGPAPISVALGDIDRNGSLDLALANYGNSSTSVYLNDLVGTEPSALALASEPPSSTYGQAVTLTATISPDSAAGVVQFLDSGIIVGSAPIVDGASQLELSGLLHREHLFRAHYLGNAVHLPSFSEIVPHDVALAGTELLLQPTASPALQYLSVRFRATVNVLPPGAGTAEGSVEFRVNGTPLGSPVALVGGVATSDSIALASAGPCEIVANYVPPDTLRFAGSTSTIVLPVETSGPEIVAVRDVPNDQGGKVFLTWRCALDSPPMRVVSGYRVWRRVPSPLEGAVMRHGLRRNAGQAEGHGVATETFWEAIADLPSAALVSYGYTAATAQDSLPGANPYTAFFIQALTHDAEFWYDSAPDSGYSVDNLAPAPPGPFTATYAAGSVALHWGASREADLREYRLYRGAGIEFVPGPENLVFAGRDTGYVDVSGAPLPAFKLAAVDVHGNASRHLLVYPDQPVAVIASLVSVQSSADRVELTWYLGGTPGLAARVDRRTESTLWVSVGPVVQDGAGFITFTDETVVAGTRYGYRLALFEGDVETVTNTAWVTPEAARLSFAGARPNPAHAGELRVRLSLPDATPARLELLDIGGRRLASREVGSLGVGTHDVMLPDAAGLPPGVYLLRLTHAGSSATRRVVLL